MMGKGVESMKSKTNLKIKMGIDFLMTILLLGLMAYQITGQALHEWFGAGMLVLFLAHNLLNIRWYGNLFKGKYKLPRIIQTIVNFSVLAAMLCLGYSGIVMSRHVFAALSIDGPMATARRMHLAASYWGFVLMSFHLGMHWGMVTGMFRRLSRGRELSGGELPGREVLDRNLSGRKSSSRKPSGTPVWISWLAAAVIAGYGLFCFIRKDIVSYMFLKNEFVFFDFEQNILSVFLEYTAMIGFWVFVGFCVARGAGKVLAHTVKKGGKA